MTKLRVPDLAAMKKRDATMARIFDRAGVDIAARIGKTRLIDNLLCEPPGPGSPLRSVLDLSHT
jgi:hypothetical protein